MPSTVRGTQRVLNKLLLSEQMTQLPLFLVLFHVCYGNNTYAFRFQVIRFFAFFKMYYFFNFYGYDYCRYCFVLF